MIVKEFLALKASHDALYVVLIDGTLKRYDGKAWKTIKATGLLKRWVDVELEWHRKGTQKGGG